MHNFYITYEKKGSDIYIYDRKAAEEVTIS